MRKFRTWSSASLIDSGHAKTAKAFILYRAEKARARDQRPEVAGVSDNIPYKVLWRVLSWNADHGCHTLAGLRHAWEKGAWKRLIRDAGARLPRGNPPRRRVDFEASAGSAACHRGGALQLGKTTTTLKISERLAAKGLVLSC